MLKKLLITALLLLGASPAMAQSAMYTFNGSVSIGAGNSFQTVLTASNTRKALTIQNNNTNGDNCWIFLGSGSAAKATSILLGQGGSYQRYYPYLPADTIQATCLSTADTLYVDVQ